MKEFEKAIGDCESVLDLGCGDDSPLFYFKKKFYSVGVDVFEPSIEISRKKNIHNEYIQSELLSIQEKVPPKKYDCVVAFEVIEHFEKEEGLKLLKIMEKLALKKVVISTPKGFMPQGQYNNNPFQIHKSGWEVKEMQNLGYSVTGFNGWKPLRKECGQVRFKPKLFWILIINLTQIIVRKFPNNAYQILCIKQMN